MKTLIFFDINGTLIKRDSRTDLPFAEAMDRTLGIENAMNGVNTAARSDKDCFLEVLQKNDIAFTEALWNKLLENYAEALDRYKETDVWRENADAVSCLEFLADKDVCLSLITGELSMGAQYKLEKLGIWQYFPTGGFGEDGLVRFEIAEMALKKAIAYYGTTFDALYVVGDTILDIQTARHLGAKIISIDTGANTKEELASHQPDYLVSRFLSEASDGPFETIFNSKA